VAWIEVHQSLPTHPKTIEAAMLLDVSEAEVVGHIICLWLWALDARQDGRLDLAKPRVLARAAQWDKEPGRFVDALLAVGFLDGDGAIHDWDDYTGRLMERRERINQQTRVRMHAYRERKRLATLEDTQEVTRNKLRSYAPTEPNPTVPTLSPTEREAPDADAPDAAPSQMRLRLPRAQTTDAVRAANTVLGKKCNEAERSAINEGIPATPQAQKLWESVLRTWKLRYERNKGLEGPLEWFAAGGPPPKRVNGAAGGSGQYVQPQSQQRNPGPAPLREPTPEEAAASMAEKARVRRQLEERHLAGRMARIGGPA
jgi:hypothetical protein